jgi:integrase
MGCVYRQKGRAVWQLKYYRDGVPICESSGTTVKDDARDLLRKREGAIVDGEPITKRSRRVTFETLADDLVNDYKINERKSLVDLESRIRKNLRPYFGGRRMASVTTADIRAYITARKTAKAANASINRELAALKRMFNLAIESEVLPTMPYFPMLEERNVRTGFFERDQFEIVRRHLPADLRGVATFAYVTGWRVPSEVLSLQWAQVNQDEGLVRLEPDTTKNDEGREFPFALMPELADLIDEQWAARPPDRICPWVFHRAGAPFLDKRGDPFRWFYDEWHAACEQAGCVGRIPHDFRRTAVRNLVRVGVAEKTAMKLTGHKSRSVFDRYHIVNAADLREAVTRLAAAPIQRASSSRGRVVRMRANARKQR